MLEQTHPGNVACGYQLPAEHAQHTGLQPLQTSLRISMEIWTIISGHTLSAPLS